MFKLGLTGSIGMGKSTTAKMFADLGCAVWDADAAVHRLYAEGGEAVKPIQALFPAAVVDGAVDRSALRVIIAEKPDAMSRIEAIVHPLVALDRAKFLDQSDADIIVLDIPILFEMGGDKHVNAVACVSVAEDVQKARVLARGSMTQAQFEQILSKQMSNDEKCARSDYVIATDTIAHAKEQVAQIVAQIRGEIIDA